MTQEANHWSETEKVKEVTCILANSYRQAFLKTTHTLQTLVHTCIAVHTFLLFILLAYCAHLKLLTISVLFTLLSYLLTV